MGEPDGKNSDVEQGPLGRAMRFSKGFSVWGSGFGV